MKNKAKSAMTMVLLAGVLISIIVYMYVYQSFNKKTEALRNENATLQTRVNELKEYYDKMEDYQKGIKEMTADIHKKLDFYPSDVREEDAVKLSLDILEKNYLVDFKAINMGAKEEVYLVPEDVVKAAALEEYTGEIGVYKKQMTFNNVTLYNDLKNIITLMNGRGENVKINSVAYVKNEADGVLEGTIVCDFYYALGTNGTYKAPTLKDFPAGKANIFDSPVGENKINYEVFGLDPETMISEE